MDNIGEGLKKVVHIGLLYDFYGGLLTGKQQECLNMYYLQDLSLKEIAEQFNTSRQAVHDILRRAEQTLKEYDQKLNLINKHQETEELFDEITNLIESLPESVINLPEIGLIAGKIETFRKTF